MFCIGHKTIAGTELNKLRIKLCLKIFMAFVNHNFKFKSILLYRKLIDIDIAIILCFESGPYNAYVRSKVAGIIK